MAPSDADDNFETHQWKSEFASTRSGRNSPNIFAKVRRQLLLTPPVRNVRSPRFTEEELDALTGDLPYATNYTYAYSKIYDPSLPDHWEVPNLGGGPSGTLAEQEHWSAASLGRQLFYLIRFPLFLILHVITYILEAFYHIIKISTYTIWDYILYLIKSAKIRYEAWQDHRRRTALIRNRQDPFRVKASRFFYRFFEILTLVILAPLRLFSRSKSGVEQYQYKSIKDQIENDRASRMMTRSQTLQQGRRFGDLSKSPSRRVPAPKSTIKTTTITRVFTSGNADDYTPEVVEVPARGIRGRSVTPRLRGNRGTRQVAARVMETPDVEVDTPLSTYGLRSRQMSHVNTPEPTFDIGHAVATSTPLFANNLEESADISVFGKLRGTVENVNSSSLLNLLWYIQYVVFFPFYASKFIILSFYDYGKSAYMKYTNFQPTPMETIHTRPLDDVVDESEANDKALVVLPWTTWMYQNISSAATIAKESFLRLFALVYSGLRGIEHFIVNTSFGIGEKVASVIGAIHFPISKRFNWCNILGLLLALLLAIFLFGFLTSDNTAIRAKELEVKANATKAPENALPTVPFYVTVGEHISHYAWMVKEYVIDIAFNVYTGAKPLFAGFTAGPKYVWGVVGNGATTVWNTIIAAPSIIAKYTRYYVTGFFALFPSSSKTVTEPIYNEFSAINSGIASIWNSFVGIFYNFFKVFTDVFSSTWKSFVGLIYSSAKAVSDAVAYIWNSITGAVYSVFSGFSSIGNVFSSVQKTVIGAVYGFGRFVKDSYYDYIYNPIVGFWKYVTGNYKELMQPVKEGFKWLGAQLWIGLEHLFWLVRTVHYYTLYVLTWPLGQFFKFWAYVIAYAPEDVVQTIPLPQAVTPTPIEVLPKAVEVEDEELTIHPAPAPQPIPIPNQEPVIIHQTNVIETVDKEAIIKEVTEKLRAELSAQFHQELSTKFETNYNALIEKLKVQNTNIQIDNAHLEGIIRQMIYEYDTDKTGQVDYALESSGGAVVSTRCSETYKSYTRLEKFWDIPIYYHHYSPRVVIQRNSKSLFPGECWCFKENRGYIAVELSHFIDVSSVSYEHIPKSVAPEGNRSSAPKNILVWAYKQIDDLNSRVLIGDYTYDLDNAPLQFFIAKHKPDFPVKFVELEVTSNYGSPFTCLYRLRVHGKIVKTAGSP